MNGDLRTKLELCHHISLAFQGHLPVQHMQLRETIWKNLSTTSRHSMAWVLIKYPPKGPINYTISKYL